MATKTVGNLKIQLDAVTNRFDRNMKNAGKRVTMFQRTANTARRVVRGLGNAFKFLGVAALGAAAAIGAVLKKNLETLDSMAKSADKLGIATEQLSGLHMAAELTGAGIEKMNDGLAKMQRNISEAAQGTGTAKDALETLGLSAEKLVSMTPEKQFSAIAEAMAGIENHSDKIAIAMDIFGRGGIDLVNTLALGKQGLASIQAEAEGLGAAFSREQLAQVEAANDAILRVKVSINAMIQRLTVALAPTIEELANNITEMVKEGKFDNITENIQRWVESLRHAGEFIDKFKTGANFILGVVQGITSALLAAVSLAVALAELVTTGRTPSDPGSIANSIMESAGGFGGRAASSFQSAMGAAERVAFPGMTANAPIMEDGGKREMVDFQEAMDIMRSMHRDGIALQAN